MVAEVQRESCEAACGLVEEGEHLLGCLAEFDPEAQCPLVEHSNSNRTEAQQLKVMIKKEKYRDLLGGR